MSKKKTALIIVIAVVLVAALVCVWYFGYKKPADAAAAAAAENMKTVTVHITHTDGSEKTLTLSTDKVYLSEALQDEALLEGEMSEYGLTISSLDGEEALLSANASWVFDVNGEMGAMSVDQTILADGDVYDFYVLTW